MLNFSPLELLLTCHALLSPLSFCICCSFSLEHLYPWYCPSSETWETHLPIWKGPPFCFHSTRCIFITLYPNCSFVCLPLLAIRSLKMWTMSDSLIHLYAENKTVHTESAQEMPHEWMMSLVAQGLQLSLLCNRVHRLISSFYLFSQATGWEVSGKKRLMWHAMEQQAGFNILRSGCLNCHLFPN